MAGERNPQEQQTLGFGMADGSARDRRIQLARAIRDLRLDSWESDAILLGLLVYDQTQDGVGGDWEACDGIILGHACGPTCKRSKFYDILRALTEAGILSVEKVKDGDGLRRRYRVLWTGVYTVRGLPLPEHLRATSDSSTETEIRTAEIRTADESARRTNPHGGRGGA